MYIKKGICLNFEPDILIKKPCAKIFFLRNITCNSCCQQAYYELRTKVCRMVFYDDNDDDGDDGSDDDGSSKCAR